MSGSFTFAGSSYAITTEAGSNISAIVAGSQAIILQASDNAEGKIMAETRYNFLNGYSSLSSYAQFLLKSAACKLAANELIRYDMAAIGRTEAEDRINFNRAEAGEIINLLKAQENAKFIVSGKTGVGG